MRLKGNRTQRGFTLIEVLVALAVLAISLAAVINGISANVSNAAHLRDRTLAHWVAMNKVAEVQTGGIFPDTGVTKGEAMLAERAWYWSMTVAGTADANVRRLDVEVRTRQDGGQSLARLVAYAGRPL
ncbi:MAG: type II secretion system minor pseudopilin GspI [Gammaproteobacteria bacterium]